MFNPFEDKALAENQTYSSAMAVVRASILWVLDSGFSELTYQVLLQVWRSLRGEESTFESAPER